MLGGVSGGIALRALSTDYVFPLGFVYDITVLTLLLGLTTAAFWLASEYLYTRDDEDDEPSDLPLFLR